MPSTTSSPDRMRIPLRTALRMWIQYFTARIREQVPAVAPIVAYLIVFHWLVMHQGVQHASAIAVQLGLVLVGLGLFLEGIRLSLMPLGESLGHSLPKTIGSSGVLLYALIIGAAAAFAEPAIGALQVAGAHIDPATAPLLKALLGPWSTILTLSVALGVGLATTLGMLRLLTGWSLKVVLYPLIALCLFLSLLGWQDPLVRPVVALAWDCGAVIAGPVTVPLVLGLGAGLSLASGKSDSGMAGFGIVTLVALMPVVSTLAAALVLRHQPLPDFTELAVATAVPTVWQAALGALGSALQALVPLALLLLVGQRFIARAPIVNADEFMLGLGMTLVGLTAFNMGLVYGLTPLGEQVSATMPASFTSIAAGEPPAPLGPLYGPLAGLLVILGFAALLGYVATLAEPALSALGRQVEDVTVGAFPRTVLVQAVACGVALGMALGVARQLFDLSFLWLIVPAYALMALLTTVASEEYANIGWDSSGVTTGPITVPLIVALGLSLSPALPSHADGFGVLALASVGPTLAVLTLGIGLTRSRRARQRKKLAAATTGVHA